MGHPIESITDSFSLTTGAVLTTARIFRILYLAMMLAGLN